ncbi:pyrroline-5-carboxylate reductase [Brachybacterium hainanense]|uniref:Pyrroline-5-carboxylate reductase n=1 Tax=Brachybacterium hainanense TaxID=1541174 RepID=A0ABV6RIY0_9MICO
MDSPTDRDLSSLTLVMLGAGSMGGAFAAAARAAGVPGANILLINSTPASSQRAAEKLGARAGSLEDLARADVLVLGVKPYQVASALPGVREHLTDRTLVISLITGLTLAALAEELPGIPLLTRAMPNTPMAVGEGVTALMHADTVPDEQRELARQLLAASGLVEEVREDQVHAVIGAAGSNTAFVLYVMEAMIDEAVRQGLTRDLATRMVEQTVRGAATLVQSTGEHPALARAAVSSPGGTTAEGVAALDRAGVRAGIAAAMDAAAAKSRAMTGA